MKVDDNEGNLYVHGLQTINKLEDGSMKLVGSVDGDTELVLGRREKGVWKLLLRNKDVISVTTLK